EDHDLAIEPGGVDRECCTGARDPAEPIRPVLPAANEHARAPALDPAERAVAVVLDLVQPLVARRWGIGDDGELPADALRQRTARGRGDALGPLDHDVARGRPPRLDVALLQQQPVLASLPRPAAHPRQGPAAAQLVPVERELELAAPVPLVRIADGMPSAAIPQHDLACPVLARWDRPLAGAVLERRVLDVHGETLLRGIEAGTLRNRPALQHAVELETEVVVQAAGGVALHDEAPTFARRRLAGRLGRAPEVALAAIVVERHAPTP